MKSFKEYITESGLGLGIDLRTSHHTPYDVDDSEVKNSINAILGHVAVSEFLNPNAAVAQMESKLGQLGIARMRSADQGDMAMEEEFGDSGEMSISFSRYGEITGKSVDTPIDELDKEEKTYDLQVRYEKLDTGSYKVYGQLV
tara:strand:- start:7396 stop:7824 length:429 start_codon:yes stop_codon:yes gene_type:complete